MSALLLQRSLQTLIFHGDTYVYAHLSAEAIELEDIGDARFKTSITFDGQTKSLELPFDEFPFLTARTRGLYYSKLQAGDQDLVGDYYFPSKDMPDGVCTIRAEAFLPDGSNLFCIEISQQFERAQ